MYISCPDCSTKFVISPDQIGANGRKVKCSKCGTIWHQKPEDNARIEPIISPLELTPLGNGVNLPALMPTKIPTFLYIMPVILISLSILMSILLFSGSIDTMLMTNVTIEDTKISHEKELNKISLSYKVMNSSNKEINMPLVRIRLLDKDYRVLKSNIENRSKLKLSPGQFIQVKTEFVPVPKNTESVDIMLGNKLDFILR